MAPSVDGQNAGLPPLSPRARLAWRRAADELLIASIFGGYEPADQAMHRAEAAATEKRDRHLAAPTF